MHITDYAFAETTFAIAQIEIPHTDKGIIKTKRQYLITLLQKALTPTVQGLGVTLADILKMLETQFLLGSGLGHDTDARNKTSRENVTLDIVHGIQGFGIAGIFNSDGLNQCQTIRFQQFTAFVEIGR